MCPPTAIPFTAKPITSHDSYFGESEVTTLSPETTSLTPNVTSLPQGCPWNYPWCRDVPQVHLAQFLVGCFLFAIGYPTTHVLAYTIFSKVLGPGPQVSDHFLYTLGTIMHVVGRLKGVQILKTLLKKKYINI